MLNLTAQMAALDLDGHLGKTPSVVCLTPLINDGEDVAGVEDAEPPPPEHELEHGAVVFYDAFEFLEHTSPAQIAV